MNGPRATGGPHARLPLLQAFNRRTPYTNQQPTNLNQRMKNFLALASASILMLGIAGCGDDPVTTEVNKSFTVKANDKFTYEVYDRDSTQAPVATSKTMRVWTVLELLASYQGQANVAKIDQVYLDSTGTTQTGRDTIYLQTNSDGTIHQYDAVGEVLKRFPETIRPFISQLAKSWAKVGDTKSTNALTWISSFKTATTVDLPLIGPTAISAEMKAQHLGRSKRPATVPAGTFTGLFSTDHTMTATATSVSNPTAPAILSDSMVLHYDFDIDSGLVKWAMDSKTVLLNPLGAYFITGFEMNLVKAERAQ
ncbi:MAG: hypothetical protein IPM61_02565 [Chlorobi bacterium]|nr:hypothetical protein [Chlorobiota bacterium]MBX7217898.1 hypothetical protein [Candidatus Kapabacteria bacterium]